MLLGVPLFWRKPLARNRGDGPRGLRSEAEENSRLARAPTTVTQRTVSIDNPHYRGSLTRGGDVMTTNFRPTKVIASAIGKARPHDLRPMLLALAVMFACVLVLAACTNAVAVVIRLNTYSDYCPGADAFCCSLLSAILSHNEKKSHGECAAGDGNDVIEIPYPDYFLSFEEPAISGNLTITGQSTQTTLDGAYVTITKGATLTLQNVSLKLDSDHFVTQKSLITNNGGTVIIRQTDLSNNGIKPPASGGAIGNYGGTVIIRRRPFRARTVAFHDNSARQGGAIYNDGGTVTFDQGSQALCERNSALDGGCIFTRNGEVSIGGRIPLSSDEQVRLLNNGGQKGGRGGAIAAENSKVTILDARIEGNNKPDNAGSAGAGGAIYLDSRSSLNQSGGDCAGNTSRLGGCIYSDGAGVTLDNLICEKNSAIDGGCIHTGPAGGTLNISNSKIRNNQATKGSRGGGLLLENSLVTITDSEITGNSAGDYGDGGIGSGGGIFGLTSNTASPTDITMVGSTLADNTASKLGAGIELENLGSGLTAVNSTFANEGPADVPTHGLHFDNSYANFDFTTLSLAPLSVEGVVEGDLRNSIFAGSSLCLGNVADGGHNLQYPQPFRACETSIPVLDPLLDPDGLVDNNGPTRTIALLADSPAIDAVPLAVCTDQNGKPIMIDQRGKPRPARGHDACDSGAYEYQGSIGP
jgi:predicted outer membrane repeat protein